MEDRDFKELQNLAYSYAMYRIGNYDVAADIAMETMALFLLKKDTVDPQYQRGWVINTVKHHVQAWQRKQTASSKNLQNNAYEIASRLIEDQTSEQDGELHKAYQDALSNLSEEELKTLLFYFQCNSNIKEMHRISELSYTSLRKKMSRIKQRLKAQTLRNLGMVASKRIVTPQLDNLIIKFIQRFKENLEAGTLEKMYYYFSRVDLQTYNPSLQIKKIRDYEIELVDNVYKVWVIFINNEDQPDAFTLSFEVDGTNHLRIVTPPTRQQRIVRIAPDSAEFSRLEALLKQATIAKDGTLNLSPDILDSIVAQVEKQMEEDE
jgi:DNA-directed RNA polymerase specialized sigma24 family protein